MIDELLNDVVASRLADASDLYGASDDDVARLERSVDVRLPSPYRAFLRAVGRGAGQFLRSDHWSFTVDALPDLNTAARRLIDEAGLRGPWFCFATRMGEAYLFFLADGRDDDPPVYCWSEGTDPRIEKAFESFGDWLRSMIADYKRTEPPSARGARPGGAGG